MNKVQPEIADSVKKTKVMVGHAWVQAGFQLSHW
jgi:hypothetical protein